MELTAGYIENAYADVYAYFDTAIFPPDSSQHDGPIVGVHGENLALWLHTTLKSKNFSVTTPSRGLVGWHFIYKVQSVSWMVTCENLKLHCTDHWKITVNAMNRKAGGAFDVKPEKNFPFLDALNSMLREEGQIKNVEWNRQRLNAPIVNVLDRSLASVN